MDYFSYRSGKAFCEGVDLSSLANALGTPLYVYSSATLDRHCEELKKAFAEYPTLVCYAVKANANLSVLKRIFSHGFGADVVSAGEMNRALAAGADPKKIVFSGVGKQAWEMKQGLEAGILSFNVESREELKALNEAAGGLRRVAHISLRVNPNIDVKTHPHIATGLYTTKFGIAETELPEVREELKPLKNLRLVGLDCHIGSQITEVEPFRKTAARMAALASEFKQAGFPLEHLDLGGGVGIRYQGETPPSLSDYAKAVISEIKATGLKLVLEPGRLLVGNSGVLLTRVIYFKKNIQRNFVIVDAAMNDLIRPSLYEAYHEIAPVVETKAGTPTITCDVVGPVCETGDFLGLGRELAPVKANDLLMVKSAGSYGMTMASNYNCRGRAAEVLVEGDTYRVVRPRESMESLWESELEAAQTGK